ncbi:MAG: phosphate acyltransferase PlsX [Kiritimatiellae bacterium]|nr:phosphate acyltransferase PlsX [Kiritimatiellia bacterium]
MEIAIDAMGGDFAPHNIVEGAIDAARKFRGIKRLYLVGLQDTIERELQKYGDIPPQIEIYHATEVVEMDDPPVVAIRRKKDSSIIKAVELVKTGKAQALFSAGNTGAAVAATTLRLRTLQGVERPAIATVIPTPKRPFILIDAGANPDCSPALLVQFAVMGDVYSREILGVKNPSIGLLSIGGEEVKGNETTKETFRILESLPLNFCGNIEGSGLFEGQADVVVCDGFSGNVVLKTSESVAKAMGKWLSQEFTKNIFRTFGALLLKTALKNIKTKSNPDTYGGAPLLGVNGFCVIGHGSSSAEAVTNAIRVAHESVSHKVNHLIEEQLSGLQGLEKKENEKR